jgi:DNA-binding transcriptional regulator YiaG
MGRKYQSEALMVNHQSAESLFRLGEISEAEMREFDEMCLVQEPEESYNAELPVELGHRQSPLTLSFGN